MSSWNFLKFPFTSVTVGSGDSYAKSDQICKTVTIVTVVSRNNNGQSDIWHLYVLIVYALPSSTSVLLYACTDHKDI